MRRFNYDDNKDDKDDVDNIFNVDDDDDDDDDDEPDEIDISDAEMEAVMQHHKHQEAINWMQVELVQHELDQRLLSQAIKMCEKGWFWKFKSWPTQLKQIARAYMSLSRMIASVKDQRDNQS